MKKRKNLNQEYLLKKTAKYIVHYIKDKDFITVYYSDGTSKSFLNNRENEIRIIQDMQQQASELDELIKKYDSKKEFWETLTFVTMGSFLANDAINGANRVRDPKKDAIEFAWYGSWLLLTTLKRFQYSEPTYDLKKVQYFITHAGDINNGYTSNPMRFDKNGRPINGYHRYTMNDIDDLSLKELRTMSEQNRQRRLEKRA